MGVGNGLAADKVLMAPVANLMELTMTDDPICDIITLKDGRTIEVIVLSESNKAIRYYACDDEGGPIYAVPVNSVKSVDYNRTTKHKVKDVEYGGNQSGGVLTLWIILGILLTGILVVLSCAAICAWGGAGVAIAAVALLFLILFNIGMANSYYRGSLTGR